MNKEYLRGLDDAIKIVRQQALADGNAVLDATNLETKITYLERQAQSILVEKLLLQKRYNP